MSVKQKYLKDENGEIFSPIVSTDSIYDSDGNVAPQIVAWCFATIKNEVVTIHAEKNIASFTLQNDTAKTIFVNFKNALKDTNYAAVVSVENNGTGAEIVGVYDHKTTYFKIDVSNYNGGNIRPLQVNVIVVR